MTAVALVALVAVLFLALTVGLSLAWSLWCQGDVPVRKRCRGAVQLMFIFAVVEVVDVVLWGRSAGAAFRDWAVMSAVPWVFFVAAVRNGGGRLPAVVRFADRVTAVLCDAVARVVPPLRRSRVNGSRWVDVVVLTVLLLLLSVAQAALLS